MKGVLFIEEDFNPIVFLGVIHEKTDYNKLRVYPQDLVSMFCGGVVVLCCAHTVCLFLCAYMSLCVYVSLCLRVLSRCVYVSVLKVSLSALCLCLCVCDATAVLCFVRDILCCFSFCMSLSLDSSCVERFW